MRINRGLLFWGLTLVTAGIVALAVQSEAIDRDLVADAWRLWPLILVAIGVSIIFARGPLGPLGSAASGILVGIFAGALLVNIPFGFASCGDAAMQESTGMEGAFSGAASVSLDFNCGDLDIATQPGNAWTLDLARAGGTEPRVDAGDDSLAVETRSRGFGLGERRHEWQVVLPTDVALELEVRVNAAGSRLDLTDADLATFELDLNAGSTVVDLGGTRVDDLEVDMNAGSVSLVVDEGSEVSGRIGYNAGSLEVCAADGVELAIGLDDPNVTFSHNLDEAGLEQRGDTWTTPGLGTGSAAVRLTIDGNAASLTLNPEDGCE